LAIARVSNALFVQEGITSSIAIVEASVADCPSSRRLQMVVFGPTWAILSPSSPCCGAKSVRRACSIVSLSAQKKTIHGTFAADVASASCEGIKFKGG